MAGGTIAVVGVAAGMAMWIISVIADVERLNREAGTLGDRFAVLAND